MSGDLRKSFFILCGHHGGFMNKKVYFSGSIRGGRADAELYKNIIAYIKRTDTVLTEHIGDLSLSALEQGRSKDSLIYEQDTDWLKQCDLVIAECTCASLGVGYELAFAENLGKPVYILYRASVTQLSAMLTGDPYYQIYPYTDEAEIYPILDRILG